MLSLSSADYLTTVLNNMRILVITKNLLLGDVLENLLHQPALGDCETLWQNVVELQPEIIILEEGLVTGNANCFITRVLKHGCQRTILVSPNKNQVHVFDNFPVLLNQATDLTSLIKKSSEQNNNVV